MNQALTAPFEEQRISGRGYDHRLAARLLTYLRPYRLRATLLLATATAAVFANTIWPKIIQLALDGPIRGGDTAKLPGYLALIVGMVVAGSGLLLLQTYLSAWIAQRAVNTIRLTLFGHIQRLPLAFFDRNPVGRLLTRVTSDVDSLNEFFQEAINFLGNFLKIAFILALMLTTHATFALLVFVCLPPLVWATLYFTRKSRESFREMRLAIARVNADLGENLSGMQVVQLFNRQARNAARHRDLCERYYQSTLRTVYYFSLFFPVMETISALGLILTLAGGAWFFSVDGISAGVLVAFVLYTEQFFEPIREMADKYNILQSAMASSERVFAILDEPVGIADPAAPVELSVLRGDIEFRGVWFAYQGERWVLEDVSFRVRPGEKVAFVGHTGAGKTTLIALLMRLYDVQRGEILIDGIDIRRYSLASLRRAMGAVLQDVFLFRGTLLENIQLGNPAIDEARVREVCRYVNADRFIDGLPGGYHARIEERGANLSVGQRQLLAFARALAWQPGLLILDEATSHVDTETEAWIQDAMQKIIRDRNVIVIAHRLSTVEHVDCIYVMHRGRLAEQGTHAELLRQRGVYYKLYQLQQSGAGAE